MVMLKFRDETDPKERSALLREFLDVMPGSEAHLLFPDVPEDDELATLFEITLSPDTAAEEVICFLEQAPEVEYAHKPATREDICF
jgi:hypothetical protein